VPYLFQRISLAGDDSRGQKGELVKPEKEYARAAGIRSETICQELI
jgi:hypothetical protein